LAGDGHLYSIDLSTGVAADLGLVSFGENDGHAFVDNKVLAIGGYTDELWDITTPPGSKIVDVGDRDGVDAGLSYDPVSGNLYNVQGGGGPPSRLYIIDMITGSATLVGSSPTVFADSLGIDRSGNAYAIDSYTTESLYSVNLSNGELTLIGPTGVTMPQSGLCFDSSGVLWAIGGGKTYTMNTSTGEATFMADVTFQGNPLSGFEGLAIVPEPSTLALLGVAALGLFWYRRKR
jgi:hypothetical protein